MVRDIKKKAIKLLKILSETGENDSPLILNNMTLEAQKKAAQRDKPVPSMIILDPFLLIALEDGDACLFHL